MSRIPPPASAASPGRFADLVGSLRQLAAAAGPPELFYTGWLQQLIGAVGAVSGRLRRPAADGSLAVATAAGDVESFADAPGGERGETASPENSSDGAVPSRYTQLLLDVYVTGRPTLVPPRAAPGDEADANPTAGLLLLIPLVCDGETRGVIELLLPFDAGADVRRDALQAVAHAAPIVAEFERRVRDKKTAHRQAIIDEVERFCRSVHEKLSLRHTAYALANDGRKLIGCDRVTVLIRRGRQYQVVAVSGLEVVETRSEAAKRLAALASVVARTGEPLTYTGQSDDLAPQLREAVGRYVDETHVRSVSVVPLTAGPAEPGKGARRQPLGALIVEQIVDISDEPGREERIKLVAEHGTAALANALEHASIPWLPLWRALGSLQNSFAPGTRKQTMAALALLVFAAATLKFVQVDFPLASQAVLQPADRRHVFAPTDGTVKQVFVRHGDRVAAGGRLVELRNVELEVSLADVTGRLAAAREQLLSVERALYEDGQKLGIEERHRLAGQRSELQQRQTSLEEQLTLLRRKREQLLVTSPIAGEVTTWNVEQLLRDRPVRQGQILIDVADTAGDWELEIRVAENDIGHLLRAQREHGSELAVGYRLAADPQSDRAARVAEVHWSAEVRGEDGNTVLVRAAVDPRDLPPLRPGAEATAKIYCGRRSLGYVWFHDGVDFLRTKILFRLY